LSYGCRADRLQLMEYTGIYVDDGAGDDNVDIENGNDDDDDDDDDTEDNDGDN